MLVVVEPESVMQKLYRHERVVIGRRAVFGYDSKSRGKPLAPRFFRSVTPFPDEVGAYPQVPQRKIVKPFRFVVRVRHATGYCFFQTAQTAGKERFVIHGNVSEHFARFDFGKKRIAAVESEIVRFVKNRLFVVRRALEPYKNPFFFA